MNFHLQNEEKAVMEAQVPNITVVFLSNSYFKQHMDKFVEVKNTKQLRKDIDEVLQCVKGLDQSRETSLAITKLQEAIMWLGMNLKRLGELDPYPESRNPDSQRIEPTADGIKL